MSDAIFLGTVTAVPVETVPADLGPGFEHLSGEELTEDIAVADFRAAEWFRGDGGSQVRVRTNWLKICGFHLAVGRSYLVYAESRDDRLWTSPFLRTKLENERQADLRKLRRRIEGK